MIQLRVRQGEDFGTLAQNYSEDASASNGGDLVLFGVNPRQGESGASKADPKYDARQVFAGDPYA